MFGGIFQFSFNLKLIARRDLAAWDKSSKPHFSTFCPIVIELRVLSNAGNFPNLVVMFRCIEELPQPSN
jgi:hypothetical protein